MRPEFDRQFDSLLREHARRGGAASGSDAAKSARDERPGGREMSAATHLDADELSAFAQNALPARARARHTAHLADCGDCRQLVSQIALASGVAEEIERREPSHAVGLVAAAAPSPTPAWRERLSSLFRPGAWRYAMPLAALLVASAAVLFVMSGRRPAELGNLAAGGDQARTGQTAELHHPAGQTQRTNTAAGASQNTATNPATESADAVKSEARASGSPLLDAQGRADQSVPGGPVVGGWQAAPPEASKSSAADTTAPSAATFAAGPAPASAPSPAPPPPMQQQPRELAAAAPKPTPDADAPKDSKAAENKEKDRYDERSASMARKQSGHGPMRNEAQQNIIRNRQAEEARAEDAETKRDDDAKKSESNLPPSSRAAGATPARSRRGEREKSGETRGSDGGERGAGTRSVGGRRFRRQGDAWVDTAYNSSQATVIVNRGSEQYRSLVGDEPDIARIASALGGEVVVVWKGRAYRIKP